MNILLVDDHPLIHIGLSYVLKDLYIAVKIEKAFDGDQMLEKLNSQSFDLVFMDINMPGTHSFSLFETILNKYPELKVIIYSQNQENIFAKRYLDLGAKAYIEKSVTDDVLKFAIQKVVLGNVYMSDNILEVVNHTKSINPFDKLSNREIEVAFLLLKGIDNAEAASSLQISSSTVSTYKLRIYEKLNVNNAKEFFDMAKLYQFT
jgi:DNA-binding NarL/FixJ family response regulator